MWPGRLLLVGDVPVESRWPLYTVLPASCCFFYCGYFFLWDRLARSFGPKSYHGLPALSKMCFRANCNSMVHTSTVVILLIVMLASDSTVHTRRLQQHYNPVGFSAMCVTLGYFSLSVPWSAWMYFGKGERQVVPLALLVHHGLVVISALAYVISLLCAFYGAIGFACMELSNVFFIPRTMADLLGWNSDGPAGTLNGICLVLSFILVRVLGGTAILILFTVDLTSFTGGVGEWLVVALSYLIFLAVLVLSYVWLYKQVLPGLRHGIQQLLVQRRAVRSQKRLEAQASGNAMPVKSSTAVVAIAQPWSHGANQIPPLTTPAEAGAAAGKCAILRVGSTSSGSPSPGSRVGKATAPLFPGKPARVAAEP